MIVIVNKPRPDAHVFADLLFPPGRNIDSDGDADIVYTRDWHYLYLKDRESDLSALTLEAEKTKLLRFEVKSQSPSQQELAAIYLYLYCGKSIEDAGKTLSSSDITRLKKDTAHK